MFDTGSGVQSAGAGLLTYYAIIIAYAFIFVNPVLGANLVTQAAKLSPNDTPRYTTQSAENPCRISTFRPFPERFNIGKIPLVMRRSPVRVRSLAPLFNPETVMVNAINLVARQDK